MDMLTKILLIFGVIAAIDRVLGNRFNLGKQFEKGICMFGPLTLAMVGMIIMSPVVADVLGKIEWIFPKWFDFSIIPASLFANDGGAAQLALELSSNKEIGAFNGLVVSSMLGCTVSFLLPYVIQLGKKEILHDLLLGVLCGISTIPIGCIVGGIICRIHISLIIINQIPLIIFALLITFGLLKCERIIVKIVGAFGVVIRALITLGLLHGIIEFLTGVKIISSTDTIENSVNIIINIVCIMVCVMPLIYILEKIFKRPLSAIGEKLGINEISALGLLTTLGNPLTTYQMIEKMDRKGMIINTAFAVSASCTFIDHLAFTMAFDAKYVFPMIMSKIIAGICAVILAYILLSKKTIKNNY